MIRKTVSIQCAVLIGLAGLLAGGVVGVFAHQVEQDSYPSQMKLESKPAVKLESKPRDIFEAQTMKDRDGSPLGDPVLEVDVDTSDPKQALSEAASMMPADAKGKKHGIMVRVWPFKDQN